MPNYNVKTSETRVRIGEVRFSYANVFTPRRNEDGTEGKYSVQLLIPKSDAAAVRIINEAIEAAKQLGVSNKWNNKLPPASKLHLPLRDGDEEFPDDDNYAGMWFMNASNPSRPALRVIENGSVHEALDQDDLYSGCYGVAFLGFYAYSTSGNMGIACGLDGLAKTRDGDKLGGGRNVDKEMDDLLGSAKSYLD